jgi:putative Mn2+ efflux pump MntP
MNKEKQPDNSYLKYSGIGFQIAAITAAGFFAGYKLDEYLRTEKPYFTALLGIIFALLGLYVSLKDFLKSE